MIIVFERQNENDGSECQNETMTLNAKLKETSMNAKLKQKLWMPN